MKLIEKIAYYGFGIMLFSIFMGAILYSVGQMSNTILVREILFWSALILIFISQINRILLDVFVKKRRDKLF